VEFFLDAVSSGGQARFANIDCCNLREIAFGGRFITLNEAPNRRPPAPRLQQQIERIGQLPKAKQRFVMEILDTVLAQASR